jgi:alcohol-forming fatty acyl-CoA reductase
MSVPEYYAGKNVFITGATGFIGKVLVEKLLRSCPAVKNIYCLTRPKKGKLAADRLRQMLDEPVSSYCVECTKLCTIIQLIFNF